MIILDKMIHAGRFTEFIQEVMRIRNDELLDKTRWEYWLHKVADVSFKEYLEMLEGKHENAVSDEMKKATVKESLGIISGFCPS